MTNKNMDARREAFEAFARDHYWLCDMSHERDSHQYSEYIEPALNVAWEAWNAALDSICVELPYEHVVDEMQEGAWTAYDSEKVKQALIAAGVPYK